MRFFNRFMRGAATSVEQGYYGSLYDSMISHHRSEGLPERRALEEAVGGGFEAFGAVEKDLLLAFGLRPEHFLVDLGCGSGRLTRKLVGFFSDKGKYLGLDTNRAFLEEARSPVENSSAAGRFDFRLVTSPVIPCEDATVDYIVAFSVATHIDLEDTYSYLAEMARALKPGGKSVVSYLSTEIPDHWRIFLEEAATPVDVRHQRVRNFVLVPGALNSLAGKAGLRVLEDIPADQPRIALTEDLEAYGKKYSPGDKIHLGQSFLVLTPR